MDPVLPCALSWISRGSYLGQNQYIKMKSRIYAAGSKKKREYATGRNWLTVMKKILGFAGGVDAFSILDTPVPKVDVT